jgi:16S rRNA (cytidine1402-2'-O)-methyltransferase
MPGSVTGPGVLYLVATPIGNLEDITLRALRILREVDWIAAEDTRRTAILLRAHGIERPLISFHAHSEHRKTPGLAARLAGGERGALVTDAGTPGVSDPGFLLAREARRSGVRVEVVPGASSVLAALLLSGFPCDRFAFLGYAPPRGSARRRFLEQALQREETVVLFESPHRLLACLEDLAALAPERPIAMCREMTKRFEEVLRGEAPALLEELKARPRKGEITLVLSGRDRGRDA